MKCREELQRLRTELEKSLTLLVASFSPTQIEQHDRDLLIEFIDNHEYGVALEWLDALVFNRRVPLSADQRTEVERLAPQMNIDLSESRAAKQLVARRNEFIALS
jgi:hypothetical protein